MLRDEDEVEDQINTKCSTTLVSFSNFIVYFQPFFQLLQIGSTWVLTAAHCLFKDGEQVAAKTLSILLGLHDRSKTSELNRCIELNREMSSALIVVICCRKKVRVDEIFLHENFFTTGSRANDIALLRLGKNSYQPKRI